MPTPVNLVEDRRLRELIGHARRLGTDIGSADDILRWLGAAIGGHARLLDPYEPPPGPGDGPSLPPEAARLVAAPGRGSLGQDLDGCHVRLHAIGPTPPHPVLVATRRGPWPAGAAETIALTVGVLDWWAEMCEETEATCARVREGVFQLLMSGMVVPARRVAHPLGIAPRLMGAAQVRVYVVGGPTAQRTQLVGRLHRRLAAAAVVVRCPVDHQRTIIAAEAADDVDARVRRVLAACPAHHVGVSLPVAPDRVGGAHDQAVRALGPARAAPDRYAVYAPEVDLARVLPVAEARRWAADRLRPLAPAGPSPARDQLLTTLRLWLAYGPVSAAGLVGAGRNTPRRRAAAVGRLLGLDPGHSLADRIELDMMLRIEALHPYGSPPSEAPGPGSLHRLLDCDEARRWAADFLARLDPVLLETVTAWIIHGQHTGRTAAALHINPKTLPIRLRRAEARLHRPLISCPAPGQQPPGAAVSGTHDLVLALHITGRLVGILVAPRFGTALEITP